MEIVFKYGPRFPKDHDSWGSYIDAIKKHMKKKDKVSKEKIVEVLRELLDRFQNYHWKDQDKTSKYLQNTKIIEVLKHLYQQEKGK